ncbi:MAG: DUF4188 domain-containing protein [Actinocrinis sp.]
MGKVVNERMTAAVEGDFVVFLIGMRFNRPWKIHKWWPVFTAMPKMLRNLYQDPESGLLHHTLTLTSSGPLVVQYWRSVEQLHAFAQDMNRPHRPAWKAFHNAIGYGRKGGDVGIWHETYLIKAGDYESIYGNMPPYGLARAGEHLPVGRRGESSAARLTAPS